MAGASVETSTLGKEQAVCDAAGRRDDRCVAAAGPGRSYRRTLAAQDHQCLAASGRSVAASYSCTQLNTASAAPADKVCVQLVGSDLPHAACRAAAALALLQMRRNLDAGTAVALALLPM